MSPKPRTADEFTAAVEQIIATPDSDFINNLIPLLKDAASTSRTSMLMQSFSRYADSREQEIERIGSTKHEEFLASVQQLQRVRENTVSLTSEILSLNQTIHESTEKLAAQKKALVDTRSVRQNIVDVTAALHDSLKMLYSVNNSHDLVRNRMYYAALKSLNDLQHEFLLPIVQTKYATQQGLATAIQNSIPSSQRSISEAVMNDLNTWLLYVREVSQYIGEIAFYHTSLRRTRLRERVQEFPHMSHVRLNSAIELVADEGEVFDVLNNDEVKVDFSPLFECLHIHEALKQVDRFCADYSATRRQQKDLLLPTTVDVTADDDTSLRSLLEGIAGFAIIEKATMRRCPQLRSAADVEELWDSMCHASVSLTSKALHDVHDPEGFLRIKGDIALFIQTMDGWGYSVTALDNFLLVLFEKYAGLLKKNFCDDFQRIVSTDDYMPMAIQNEADYAKMYPLCCIDIRNLMNRFYTFSDDHFQHATVIDDSLRIALDELLTDRVCRSLTERLESQYLSQIVQILINLEHFEFACGQLEQMLISARSTTSAGGLVVLQATNEFRTQKKAAEKRIFELVNSKIDDLIDTAEYEWVSQTVPKEPSSYIQTLTRYLTNIMNSTLMNLPREIKELIYFDALSHAATKILGLPLAPEVKQINPNGVLALANDVEHLTNFVVGLENGTMLRENLDELTQTVALMKTDNTDEFFDIALRNKKYNRVDPLNGPRLLEKYETYVALSPSHQVTLRTRLLYLVKDT